MKLGYFLIFVFFCYSIICSKPPALEQIREGSENYMQQTDLENIINQRCSEIIVTIQHPDGSIEKIKVRFTYEQLLVEDN